MHEENISEMILFVSSLSYHCRAPVNYILQNQLPIKIVRLDSASIRQKCIAGRKISIRDVPSLIVIYEDGDLKMFLSEPKIVAWIRQYHEMLQHKIAEDAARSYRNPILEDLNDTKQSKKKKKKNKKSTSKKNKIVIDDDNSLEFVVEEDEGESEGIAFVDEDEGGEEQPKQPVYFGAPPERKSKKEGGMASLRDQAKKMEADRLKALGYDPAKQNQYS